MSFPSSGAPQSDNQMRFLVLSFVVISMLTFAAQQSIHAARFTGPVSTEEAALELIVFESPRCDYCPLIRRDVLPVYQRSSNAKDVPMRFVDLQKIDTSAMNLRAPLRIMPTMILMKDGTEVDRIGGYVGPELFFHAISRMINRARQ